MKLQNLCKRAKTLWIVSNILALVLLTAIMGIALLLCVEETVFPVIAGIIIGFWLILAVLLLIWPSLTYRNYTYGYDDKRIILQHGVVFKHKITAPLCQVQDLHFYEGPIMRLFGIGKIIFSTGGSNFELVGMDKNEAQRMIDEVEARLRARVEEHTDEEI